MIITDKIAKIDTTNKLTVAFDVSKAKLNLYSEIAGKVSGTSNRHLCEVRDEIKNSTQSITKTFRDLTTLALKHGFCGLHIVSEPTGPYGHALMRIAHQSGHSTAYISGECVHKSQVIENNDASKSDIKDPRTIFMLSSMGKELTYRTLPPLYKKLRELNAMYDEADTKSTEAKCKIHSLIVRLFCDFPMSKDFIYTTSGYSLMNNFGYNPFQIVSSSFDKFARIIRTEAPGIRLHSLKQIYQHAQYSALHMIPEEEHFMIQQHLKYVWEDFIRADERKMALRKQIEACYLPLFNSGELIPRANHVFTPFQICRIAGETGPIQDFLHWRVLFKYAGVNLRIRESGFFKGQLRFSKKGRNNLRAATGKLVFRLVRKHEIYGPYFHKKKECCPTMPRTKIMANVERKLLRVYFSLANKREAFSYDRFTACESQFRLAA